jgi:hypothetical protein
MKHAKLSEYLLILESEHQPADRIRQSDVDNGTRFEVWVLDQLEDVAIDDR